MNTEVGGGSRSLKSLTGLISTTLVCLVLERRRLGGRMVVRPGHPVRRGGRAARWPPRCRCS